jgi:hypothetical protein
MCSFLVGVILRDQIKKDEMSGTCKALVGEELEETAFKI